MASKPSRMVLSLTGCISNSPGLQNIFLITPQEQTGSSNGALTKVQLRIGYFGMCVHAGAGSNCYLSVSTTPENLQLKLNSTMNLSDTDITRVSGLFSAALPLQTKVFLPLLAAAGSFFLLGVAFLMIFKWSAKRSRSSLTDMSTKRQELYRRGLTSFVWASVGLAIASAVSITESSAALQYWSANVSRSSITASAGMAMQVLQWMFVGLSVIFALAVTSMLKAAESGALLGPGGNGLPPKPVATRMPPPGPPSFAAQRPPPPSTLPP
ncbi:uncharacterized protein BP5553_09930 [Venustampulla echinocandica]|uniref:Uncharacterized protein n=1 Tax=Venustampulla echinocandica TaxID=2656787 RepID=A0A370TB36_9HELO|nr:uncharacterized protein BP5553_09930 [Venustampulla echinocandica]RDL31141.1 hypothetical protein BP5553_09930 [Venustampulla echinocandica]